MVVGRVCGGVVYWQPIETKIVEAPSPAIRGRGNAGGKGKAATGDKPKKRFKQNS